MSASRFLFFPQRLYVSATSFKSVQQGFYLGYKPFTAVSYKADTFFFWERVVLSEAFNTATDRYYWNNYKIRNVTLNSTWHVLQKYYICFVLLPLTIRNQESVTINNKESEIGHWRSLFLSFISLFTRRLGGISSAGSPRSNSLQIQRLYPPVDARISAAFRARLVGLHRRATAAHNWSLHRKLSGETT